MTTIEQIESVVDQADKFRNSYFFNPPTSARERRSYESYHSRPEVKWIDSGDTYTAEFHVSCSCHYVYARGIYTKNGKRTNLKAIRNSLSRIRESSTNAQKPAGRAQFATQ